MNKFFVEEPKNMIINLIISFVVILATVAFAGLSGSDLVIQTAWYILIIHWIAFLPALIFKTEKFYDLTGSICYAFGSVFVYYQTYGATFSLSLFINFMSRFVMISDLMDLSMNAQFIIILKQEKN